MMFKKVRFLKDMDNAYDVQEGPFLEGYILQETDLLEHHKHCPCEISQHKYLIIKLILGSDSIEV